MRVCARVWQHCVGVIGNEFDPFTVHILECFVLCPKQSWCLKNDMVGAIPEAATRLLCVTSNWSPVWD